jgi:hypothetical protein
MRVFLILLRIGVLCLALGGAAASGFLGARWWNDLNETRAKIAEIRLAILLARELAAETPPNSQARADAAKAEAQYNDLPHRARTYPFLLAGAVLGALGGVLALLGRTTSAAALLIVVGAGPGALVASGSTLLIVGTVIFTCPLVLAGMLSLFVSFLAFVTRPKEAPADRGADEEEGPPRSKTSPKRKSARDEDEEGQVDSIRTSPKRKSDLDEDEGPAPPKDRPQRKRRLDEEEPAPPDDRPKRKRE